MANFTKFIIGNPGAINKPIQTMPWLFTKCKTFSATLKSGYLGNFNSKSQGQNGFNTRRNRLLPNSPITIDPKRKKTL